MYKALTDTLFIGRQIDYIPECGSTNSLVMSTYPNNEEGFVLVAGKQSDGRGQRGNIWESEKDMNLLISILLKPIFLAVTDQFYLNIVTSLAIKDTVKEYVDGVFIKWANDVLVKNKKVAGILIETAVQKASLTNAVVGIGLNVNQKNFAFPLATSLSVLTEKELDLKALLEKLLFNLEKRYIQLRSEEKEQLRDDYLSALFGINRKLLFNDGQEFEGIIKGINKTGQLIVDKNGTENHYSFQEISLIMT